MRPHGLRRARGPWSALGLPFWRVRLPWVVAATCSCAEQLCASPAAPALAAAVCRAWAAAVRAPRSPAVDELVCTLRFPLACLWECEGAEAAVAEHFAPALLVALASADEEVRGDACQTLAMALLPELQGRGRPPRAPAVAALARQRGLPAALVGALRWRGQGVGAAAAAAWAAGELVRAAGDTAEPLSRLIAASGDALAALARVVESFARRRRGPWRPASRCRQADPLLDGCLLHCGDARAARGGGGRRGVGAARGARALWPARGVAVRGGRPRRPARLSVLHAAAAVLGSLLQAAAPMPPRRCLPLRRSCRAPSRAWRRSQLAAQTRTGRSRTAQHRA